MFNKSHWIIIIFNAIYIVAFGIYYISIKNFEFLIYILVLILVAALIGVVMTRVKLSQLSLWGLSVWGLLHMMGGGIRINGNTLYSQHLINIIDKGGQFYILKMDQLIHFYGFAIAALVVFEVCWPRFKDKKGKFLPVFIAWIGSMGLGAINEVVEFVAFITLAQTGVGDIYNTGLDLIFNLFGALTGALAGYFLYRHT